MGVGYREVPHIICQRVNQWEPFYCYRSRWVSCLVYTQWDGKSTLISGGRLVNQLIISDLPSCPVIRVARGSKLVPLTNLVSLSFHHPIPHQQSLSLSVLLPLLNPLCLSFKDSYPVPCMSPIAKNNADVLFQKRLVKSW